MIANALFKFDFSNMPKFFVFKKKIFSKNQHTMKLCENANETYVLPSYKIDEFFAVKNNRIIGWLGK